MGVEGMLFMILAHVFGMRGHLFGTGVLLFLIVVACAVIIATWPSKPEAK
jgi:hypothetical protein